MDGFRLEVERALLAGTPHVRVRPWAGAVADWRPVAEEVRKIDGVAAAGPFVDGHVFVRSDVGDPLPAQLEGIDPAAPATAVVEHLVEGAWPFRDGIVIGSEFAHAHGVRVGDALTLVAPSGRAEAMPVTGIFRTGFYEIDYGRLYASTAAAGRILGVEGVTGIDARCADPVAAAAVADRIEASARARDAAGSALYAVAWTRARANLLRAMKIERAAIFVVESFIVLVAAFQVASILLMVVTRKTREIGVLGALGATRGQLLAAFALQGLALGVIGAGAGAAAGLAVCAALRRWPLHLPGGGEVYVIENVPVAVSPSVVAAAAGIAVVASVVCALYPARAAAAITPAQALRHE
jgi:lipoprotein-releasing system permease protein